MSARATGNTWRTGGRARDGRSVRSTSSIRSSRARDAACICFVLRTLGFRKLSRTVSRNVMRTVVIRVVDIACRRPYACVRTTDCRRVGICRGAFREPFVSITRGNADTGSETERYARRTPDGRSVRPVGVSRYGLVTLSYRYNASDPVR